MLERYTEKARRAIFFARYEASQFGSPYIESEHLLLNKDPDSQWGYTLNFDNSAPVNMRCANQQ
jgi:hypothetical protein